MEFSIIDFFWFKKKKVWNFPHFIGGRGQCSGSVISTPKIWVSKWIKSPKYSFRRNVFFPHWGVWHSEYFWVLDSGLYSALSQCCWGIILVMLVMTSTPPVFPNLMLGTQVVNTTPSPTMGFWRQNLEKNKRFVILKWFLGKFEQFWKILFFHSRRCQNTEKNFELGAWTCIVWLTRW